MQQIINFLIRNKNNLLFLLLLGFSLFLTIQAHSYQKSRILSSANFLSGGIYSWTSEINEYFNLKAYNKRLLEENEKLRSMLAVVKDTAEIQDPADSLSFDGGFIFKAAEVINNNYSNRNNYLTLERGAEAGLRPDMGVVTSEGIVGIIEEVSEDYSTAISILNSNSKINAQLKKTNHFGTLIWNGQDPNVVQLIDVPAIAPVEVGDTIITGGRSLIFPKGIPIGEVIDFETDPTDSYYTIHIELFNDMTNIGYVYVIENPEREEIEALQNKTKDE